MRLLILVAFTFTLAGCAGLPLPFTEARLGHWPVESDRREVNSGCVELETLNVVVASQEAQHLTYLRAKDEDLALKAKDLPRSLGSECQTRFSKLSTSEIKHELFGDIQIVGDATKLRELGGVAFDYQDVSTQSTFEISLHQNNASSGPHRRLVAIYRLSDDVVIHYNYSGTNNVDRKDRRWPIDAFFGTAAKAAAKVIIP